MTRKSKPRARITDAEWDMVERHYRANALSIPEIGRRYGIKPDSIKSRARRKGWQRDLGAQVRAETQALMQRRCVDDSMAEEGVIVSNAAVEASTVLIGHQNRNHRLGKLVDDAIEFLERYDILSAEDGRGVDIDRHTNRLNQLSAVAERLQKMQRTAYNMDAEREDSTVVDDLSAFLDARLNIEGE